MKTLSFLNRAKYLGAKLGLISLATAEIDMKNDKILERVAKFTIDLSEDMYCPTLEQAECGDTNFYFTENSRYTSSENSPGSVIEKIKADPKELLPKTLIYDWNGDSSLGIPPTRIVAFRGTHSLQEWEGNFDCLEKSGTELGIEINGRFHQNFMETAKKVWDKIKNQIENCGKPVIFTGHSRGAAIAELLHVIAKKNIPSQNFYTMAFAPPPSMYLEESEKFLTTGIYGFSYQNDPVTRFSLKQLYVTICKTTVGCKTITEFINGIAAIAAPISVGLFDSYAVQALHNKMPTIKLFFDQYKKDPNTFKIYDQVGETYSLTWVNKNKGCSPRALKDFPPSSRRIKPLIEIPHPILKLPKYLKDHDPRFYRHSLQDPICPASRSIVQIPSILDYDEMSRKPVPLSERTMKSIEYPSWLPSITDGDDFVSCDVQEESQEGKAYLTSFEWDNIKTDIQCAGILENCDTSKIIAATCDNVTHFCYFNSLTKQDLCIEKEGTSQISQDENDLRCMTQKKCKKVKKHICSEDEECEERTVNENEDCSSKTGKTISSIYVGSTPLFTFPKGYQMMKKARKMLGHIVPSPELQHTAIWVSDDDSSDDSKGSVIVYGQYYGGKPNTYLSCDGARAYLMSLGDFKKAFNHYQVKKLKPSINITLGAFLSRVKRSGTWSADAYDWSINNCQHFTGICLDILKAKRSEKNDDDWIDLPAPVMNSISRNELKY